MIRPTLPANQIRALMFLLLEIRVLGAQTPAHIMDLIARAIHSRSMWRRSIAQKEMNGGSITLFITCTSLASIETYADEA